MSLWTATWYYVVTRGSVMLVVERIIVCKPRGYCAGVVRAIDTVDSVLRRYGAPVYVRGEIVHNSHVLEAFRRRGVLFIKDLDEVPPGSTVIFSAHGVAPSVRLAAAQKNVRVIDATCPLVTKVHREAKSFADNGYSVVLVGHAGHDEVIGISGEVNGRFHLVSGPEDALLLEVEDPTRVAILCQTTLSVSDTAAILSVLEARFPTAVRPPKEDICYATQNRQLAVREVAQHSQVFLVIGSKNSSNSNRLREVAENCSSRAYLIENKNALQVEWLEDVRCIGISAGASTPEVLVEELVEELRMMTGVAAEEFAGGEEHVSFLLPSELVCIQGRWNETVS